MKTRVNRSIEYGGDALDANQFADKMVGQEPMKNTIVMVGKIEGESKPTTSTKQQELKGISSYHDFEFLKHGGLRYIQCFKTSYLKVQSTIKYDSISIYSK